MKTLKGYVLVRIRMSKWIGEVIMKNSIKNEYSQCGVTVIDIWKIIREKKLRLSNVTGINKVINIRIDRKRTRERLKKQTT